MTMLPTKIVEDQIAITVFNNLSFKEKNSIFEYQRNNIKEVLEKYSKDYWITYQKVELIVETFQPFLKDSEAYRSSFREKMINSIMDLIEDRVIIDTEKPDF